MPSSAWIKNAGYVTACSTSPRARRTHCRYRHPSAPPSLYTLSLHDALPIFIATIVIGVASALIVGWLVGGGILGFILAVIVAVILVSVYARFVGPRRTRSEERSSELQSPCNLVCRLLLGSKTRGM